MARSRRQQFQSRPRSPNRSWAGTSSTGVTGIPVSTKVLLGSFSLSNPNIDETILRTVGTLMVSSDQLAASEDQIGAFGMYIVNDVAATLGVTALPGPITDIADDGWYVYVPICQRFGFSDATGWNADFGLRYPFDSKAKRKMHEGTRAVLMAENATSTNVFNMSLVIRSLTMVTGT